MPHHYPGNANLCPQKSVVFYTKFIIAKRNHLELCDSQLLDRKSIAMELASRRKDQ